MTDKNRTRIKGVPEKQTSTQTIPLSSGHEKAVKQRLEIVRKPTESRPTLCVCVSPGCWYGG